MYTITNKDLKLTKSHTINPRIKIDIYNENDKYIDTIIGGIIDGSLSIDAESDVRRTITLSFTPCRKMDTKIAEGKYLWLDKYVYLYIGFYDEIHEEETWYAQGKYVFTDASITYDATTNQVSINASDLVAKLNGTVNGELGQQIISYPAYEYVDAKYFSNNDTTYSSGVYKAKIPHYKKYKNGDLLGIAINKPNSSTAKIKVNALEEYAIKVENEDGTFENLTANKFIANKYVIHVFRVDTTHKYMVYQGKYGTPTVYNSIREALITCVTQLGRVDKNTLEIDDIGEYKALQEKNPDWEQYREESPHWGDIPYDLEFSSGASVWSIVQEIVGLYPGYQAYFNEENKLCVNMTPSCYEDDTLFENGFLNEVLVSENTNIDFTPVRNVVEVWGSAIDDVNFFADEGVSYSDKTYSTNIVGYDEKYYNGDLVALRIPETNDYGCKININKFGALDIYDEETEEPIKAKRLEEDGIYVFKVKTKYINKKNIFRFYLLGQWQPHAICVLTDGTVGDEYHTTSGTTVKRYSKEYFQDVYECETVGFVVLPDSPFTIQALGEVRLKVCSGGEYDNNITSDSLALAQADYEIYKAARLTDNISITVKYMPYMDVNVKVQYQGVNEDSPQEYIVKSVSHDFAGGTTSLNLMRFYPLYIPEDFPELME